MRCRFPNVPEDYGSIVWKRISHRLPARRVAEFLLDSGAALGPWPPVCCWARSQLGRISPHQPPSTLTGSPEKVLLVAVGDHLDRTQMVLAEIANSGDPGKGTLDISYERKLAADLVESNRLYRVSADTNGDRATAALLDDLERVLLEIAHSPSELSGSQIGELRREIEGKGLLFKVRVYQTKIQGKRKRRYEETPNGKSWRRGVAVAQTLTRSSSGPAGGAPTPPHDPLRWRGRFYAADRDASAYRRGYAWSLGRGAKYDDAIKGLQRRHRQ